MRADDAPAFPRDSEHKPGFTRRTQALLAAMRVAAYSLATLFMIVMILRGVWLTQAQMEAQAARSVATAVATLEVMAKAGPIHPAQANAVLRDLAPIGLELALVPVPEVPPLTPLTLLTPRKDDRTELVAIKGSAQVLRATLHRATIRNAAWRLNIPYILLVAALGIPVIVIFLVMGWLINQPALKLLRYAQSHHDEEPLPPALPSLWASVLARLQDLRDSQAQMQAFLDNAPVAMAFIDPATLTIRMINRHGASYYELEPEDMRQKGPEFLRPFFPEFDQRVGMQMLALSETRTAVTFEVEFCPLRRQPMQLLATIFPVFDHAGHIDLLGWITVDVSDARRAQEELNRSVAALHQSEKLAALGGMLAGVSHELNNPLAAVIGQAALLAEDLEATRHSDRITKIRRAADRCARIVQSFLAMARQKGPEYRSVAIADQVHAAIELTEYQMRASNVRIELHLPPDLPLIDADPDQLHQVIVNLLTNARQAMEDIAADPVITIHAQHHGDMIRLTIADNGKGIPPDMRDRIFDPFFTTKAVGSGTGIGLSYSLGIIEAHGGTLTIADALVGTTFVISLPVNSAGRLEDAPAPLSALPGKGRALVIDDEEDVAETLADMLIRQGLDVEMAVGGRAGQAALAAGTSFDIVLSDIRMPDCDGPTLYRWIAQHRPDLVGRIAFVTGDTLSGGAVDFIAAADCHVLEKPFTPAGLRQLVHLVIEQVQ